jgi:hypothetical protein
VRGQKSSGGILRHSEGRIKSKKNGQDLTQQPAPARSTVVDQSGSIVIGSVVTISSQSIGFSKSVTTGPDGQYEVRYLLPED